MSSITALPNPVQGNSGQIGSDTAYFHKIKAVLTPDKEQYQDAWRQELAKNWSSGGYVQMPTSVLNSTLSQKAKLVYEQLISYMWFKSDNCWPGQQELAEKLHCSPRTIIRALQELYDRGYIEIEQRGLGKTNRYLINPLSFAQSFHPTISGPRTAYRMPHQSVFLAQNPLLHQTIDAVVRRPVEPFYPEVTKCHTGSDKMSLLQVPESHTNYTKSNLDESEKERRDSRSGPAAELGVGSRSPATIRNDNRVGTKSRNEEQNPNGLITKKEVEDKGGAARVEAVKTTGRKKHGKGETPPPLPMRVEAALKPISLYLCDQSPKSSKTSVAWLYAEMRKRGVDTYGFEPLLEQVRHLTISKTRTITRRNADGSIAQMPYFLSILESSVNDWCHAYDALQSSGTAEGEPLAVTLKPILAQVPNPEERAMASFTNPEAILAEELAPIDVLAPEESPATPEPISTEPLAPAEVLAPEESPATSADVLAEELAPADVLAEESPATPEAILAEEPAPPPTEPISIEIAVIATDDPKHGWSKQNATWNADRVRTYVGRDAYTSTICPTRSPERYGFVIQERRTGSTWEFFTQDQVRTCMNPRR